MSGVGAPGVQAAEARTDEATTVRIPRAQTRTVEARADGVRPGEAQTGNVFRGDVSTGENGTVNAFGGDQHNYGDENNYYLSVNALRRRIRYAADPARIARELRQVVPPPGLEQDLAVLGETRLLVIAGGARTGLSTAARHRWQSFAAEHAERRVEELFASGSDELLEDLGHQERASVLLLDVSHDRDLTAKLIERSAEVLAALHERDSHLVIAVGDASLPGAERVLRESIRPLGRPDPVAVMAKRMRRTELLRRLERNGDFTRRIADRWPPMAVQVAELLDGMPPETALDALVEEVESRLASWSNELRPLFEEQLTSGASRALLLATSALEGTGRDAIAFAAKALTEIAGEEANPSVLVDPSLNQQFADLEPVLADEGGTFRNPGYGEEVLPFAWRQFPTWRAPIRTWLDLLLRPQRLKDDTLAVLLPRLLSFASATGAADLVTARATTIAGEASGSRFRRELAAGLLLAGAIDPTIGQQVRRQLWIWSYHRSGVSVAMQRTVAQVCGDPEYAARFPRNALTRLKHLLRSEVPAVSGAATEAVVSAARVLPPQTVIEELTEWVAYRSDPRLRTAAVTVVLALIDDDQVRYRWTGDRLAHDSSGAVGAMWRTVFTHASPGRVREVVAAWLGLAAAVQPEYRAILADHLAEAATGSFWTLGQLSQALDERWWAERDADGEVLALRGRIAAHLSQAKVAMQ